MQKILHVFRKLRVFSNILILNLNKYLVPTPGLEPGRPYGQGILSPLRLPIPPSGL